MRSFRLKRATQLLVQNKLRISEVASMVGFSEKKYFIKCFKEEF
ncbi:MAG: helix-turn-helix domain-containing protein [Marinilabiliaceae bacterium]|nr:helix-turn-helix domain-containing protein [Marinilabiliaceae bacterium]